MNIIDLLSSILNPNPGQNRLVAPNANGPNYLTQTGLGPEQLARFHQMSGMGGQAAPPQSVAPQQAQMPDQQQTASTAASAPQGGGILSRLFGGGQNDGANQTIQWLQQQGMDQGTATMMANNKQALQEYLLKRSQGQQPQKPIEIAGRLVDPNTYKVLADFSTPPAPDVKTRTMTPDEVKAAGLAPGVWQIDKENKISKAGDAAPAAGGKFRFDGASIEGQALNGMMDSGALTEAQAQQIAAGKTVTNPADGSIIFLTPAGIFSQATPGGPAVPIQPTGTPPPASSGAVPSMPPGAPLPGPPGPRQALDTAAGVPQPVAAPAPNAPVSPAIRQGVLQITAGKPGKMATAGEERNRSLYLVAEPELKRAEDNFSALQSVFSQAASKTLPWGLDNYATSPEYQRAANSVGMIAQLFLYSSSGQAAPDAEVAKIVKAVTPMPGESAMSVEDKRSRLKTMVDAIRIAGGNAIVPSAPATSTGLPAPAADGWREVAPGVKLRKVN